MAALGHGDGEFERGFARGMAEDRGAGEQAPAQRGEFGALRLTKPTLETDAQIECAGGEVAGCFGRPERTSTGPPSQTGSRVP